MWSFGCHFLCIFFIILSPFKSISWPSLNASGCISGFLKWWQCLHFCDHLFLLWLHIHLIKTSLPSLSFYLHLLQVHVCWPILSWFSIFGSCELSFRDKKATQLHALVPVHANWISDVQWPVTKRLGRQELAQLVTDHDVHRYLWNE